MTYLAAAGAPQQGWGGPVAILAALAALYLLHIVMSKIRNPSPTPPRGVGSREKPQVEAGSDPDEPDGDPGWWGRIVEKDGVRVRQVRQVWKTGSSELPPGPEPEQDDELDLDLEDDGLSIGEWMLARDASTRTNELIRLAAARFRVSVSTAKRALREARSEQSGS